MPFKQNERWVDERGNEFDIQGILERPPNIAGRNNKITIGPGGRVRGIVEFGGDHNTITIGKDAYFADTSVISFIETDNAVLDVGPWTTVGAGTSFQFHESARVILGKDCMFSSGCMITVSDMHPIYELATGERANSARDIIFGDHVWIGYRSFIAKGAEIGSGTVIGAMSVVNGQIPENVIAAGHPATVKKEGIKWERNFRREKDPQLVRMSG